MRRVLCLLACVASLAAVRVAPPPSVEDLKRVLETTLQSVKPTRFAVRTVLFEDVGPSAPSGGVFPFVVTAMIHDYSPGVPSKQDYGQTCLRRMENWTFGLKGDSAKGWTIEGRMAGADSVCMDNPAEGESAFPLESLVSAGPGLEDDAGNLPAGAWSCFDENAQPIAAMRFVLKAKGKYTDANGRRGGSFVYSASKSEIAFRFGFLSGKVGTNVQSSGFAMSETVTCEPVK